MQPGNIIDLFWDTHTRLLTYLLAPDPHRAPRGEYPPVCCSVLENNRTVTFLAAVPGLFSDQLCFQREMPSLVNCVRKAQRTIRSCRRHDVHRGKLVNIRHCGRADFCSLVEYELCGMAGNSVSRPTGPTTCITN